MTAVKVSQLVSSCTPRLLERPIDCMKVSCTHRRLSDPDELVSKNPRPVSR